MAKRDLFRMFEWMAFAVFAYLGCILLRSYDLEPQLQTVLWKLGNVSVAAHAGYWIDRRTFKRRITTASTPLETMRRAVVIAAAMLSVGLGL